MKVILHYDTLSATVKKISLAQHDIEIQKNRAAWERKPLLRKIYDGFYAEILAHLRENISGAVVELGSGIGNFKIACPKAIATDIFPNPWIDQVENAYHLSFADGTVSNLILFDVFHHLAYPVLAFRELQRVVPKGGRIIIFEPYISLFGLVVYGIFHHEPIAFFKKIPWFPADGTNPDDSYYAAQGNATRIFGTHSHFKSEIQKEWKIVEKKEFPRSDMYSLVGLVSRRCIQNISFLLFSLLNACLIVSLFSSLHEFLSFWRENDSRRLYYLAMMKIPTITKAIPVSWRAVMDSLRK